MYFLRKKISSATTIIYGTILTYLHTYVRACVLPPKVKRKMLRVAARSHVNASTKISGTLYIQNANNAPWSIDEKKLVHYVYEHDELE